MTAEKKVRSDVGPVGDGPADKVPSARNEADSEPALTAQRSQIQRILLSRSLRTSELQRNLLSYLDSVRSNCSRNVLFARLARVTPRGGNPFEADKQSLDRLPLSRDATEIKARNLAPRE